jgi:hypothetical protein
VNALVQNALVAAIVLGAAGFLVWRRVRARRKLTPYCSDCPGCATNATTPAAPQLVSIGDPAPHAHGPGARR